MLKFCGTNPALVDHQSSQGWREEKKGSRLRKFKGRKIDGITLRQKAEKCKILATNCGKSVNARYCLLTGTII